MSSFSDTDFSLEGIDGVQDYPWGNVEGSKSCEMYSHLSNLVQSGNKAFRENRFDQAIEFYSRANSIKQHDPIILCNRAIASIRVAHFIKHRPPTASEHEPLSGSDPTTHAALAVKDAEKLINFSSSSAIPYILKANALILLEKYELAREVIHSGLQIDPQSTPLLNLERLTANIFMRRSHVKRQRTNDYDCTLCLKLLYEPITTPCGHTFCRSCLFQCMDRGNRCPLCRTVMLISPRTCTISITLNNIIQKNFPEEYAERKLENDHLTNPGVDMLPLFVMDAILPCQTLQLTIVEPRYRLMVRRIMEGNRRMGMTIIDSSTGSVADHACEVEITDCEPLPDGGFVLEVESRRRFHILQSWDQDGYRIAEVEWIKDTCPADEDERNALLSATQKAAKLTSVWFKGAREAAKGDTERLEEIYKKEGMMPDTKDPERFSFWLATVPDYRPSEILDLLRLRDTKERILLALIYLRMEDKECKMQ